MFNISATGNIGHSPFLKLALLHGMTNVGALEESLRSENQANTVSKIFLSVHSASYRWNGQGQIAGGVNTITHNSCR